MNAFDIILTILTIIGSLGIFLYGMILMSESLQKVAGMRMRQILSTITSNNIRGVLTGLSITGLIQSSSATTVMIVSFVNAGLISLRRSLSLIMGSNIGTTVTAWVIVILGFGQTFNISTIVLPLVAVSLPMFFSGKNKQRSWAEFMIGFAILFIGLQFLKSSIPVVDEHSSFVQQFTNLIHFGYFSILLFVGIGILLTVIFQSSSAVMALTFVIAVEGWIPFEIAAAMVLGENLGTTITANIAALVANRPAKRAALFHVLFNMGGIIWALILFRYLLNGIDLIMTSLLDQSPATDPALVPLALAIFHSGFNILNTFIFIGLVPASEQLLKSIIKPGKKGKGENYRLIHMGSSYLSTSELSIIQARKEIIVMGNIVLKLFNLVPALMVEWEQAEFERIYKKIKKYEKITDRIEDEITEYLGRISESKLSHRGTTQVQNMLRIVDNLESIGDSCRKMAMHIHAKNQEGLYFIQDLRDDLNILFNLVNEAIHTMTSNISADEPSVKQALLIEEKINSTRDQLKNKNISNLKEGVYNQRTGTVFTDLIHHCERIGDYCINISESLKQEA